MLRKAAGNFFIFNYAIVIIIYLAAAVTPYLNPAYWWFVGFFGLIYPYLLLILVVMTICSFLIRPKWAIAGIIALAVSFTNIATLFALNLPKDFETQKQTGKLRVMTWNIRRFTPYNKEIFDPEHNNLSAIAEEVRKYDPDVLCFQEFFTGTSRRRRNLELFRDSLGFHHVSYAQNKNGYSTSSSGAIIFSKYPILNKYVYRLPNEIATAAENPVAADVVFGEDTIRIMTFHMQSYGFLNREYEDLYKIKTTEDTGLKASRNIFRKMRYAFSMRGMQADLIRNEIANASYPVIACGDMNDVPNSYSYVTVKQGMSDAFLEKGAGLGKSFISGRSKFLTWLPTLRIDYIFSDPSFKITQFRMVTRDLSDHRGLITDIELPKK
jgi:endonuclease/exonuclease/phosphatase family metal-dependent hydrolase